MQENKLREESRFRFGNSRKTDIARFIFILVSLSFTFSPAIFSSDQTPVTVVIPNPNAEVRAASTWISVPPDVKRRSPFPRHIIWNTWWRVWIIDEYFGFGVTPLSLKEDPFTASVKFRDPWEPLPKSEVKARKMKWILKTKNYAEDQLDETPAAFINRGIKFSWSSYLYFKDWNREFKEKHHLHPRIKIPISWKMFMNTEDISRIDGELKYKRSFDSTSELFYALAGTRDLKRVDYWLVWKRFNDVGAVKHTVWRPFRSFPVLKQIDEWTAIERLDDFFSRSVRDQNEEFIISDYD